MPAYCEGHTGYYSMCTESGLLATDECKNDPSGDKSYTELFVKGTKPTEYCDCHVKAEICTISRKTRK